MNPTNSLQFLTLLLLSIEGVWVCCWDVPSTSVPTHVAGAKPAVPGVASATRDGAGGHTEDGGHVLETHHTTCQITTEELVATAQATATRVLTGLCNSREMEDRFKSLEAQISDLLNVLKLMIVNLDTKISTQNQVLRPHRVQSPTRSGDDLHGCAGPKCASLPIEDVRSYPREAARKPEEGKWADEADEATATLADSDWPREEEISRLNNTVHMEPYPDVPLKNAATVSYRVYTYYWRVHGMASKINSWDPRRSLRSPSFYITPGGYRMYLLVFPRQSYENFYVHVGITVGGNDANLPWPFALKHRIQLLDQVRPAPSNKKRPPMSSRPLTPQDLTSRLWNPALLCSASVWRRPISGDSTECVGLGYPHEVLKSRSYIYDDSVVIKLTAYLS